MNRRKLLTWLSIVGGSLAAVAALIPFTRYMRPSARAKAKGDPIEVEFSDLHPGELKTVEWRGRAFWLLRRTPEMLASLPTMAPYLLDTEVPEEEYQPLYVDQTTRSIEPELLVVEATCTHLGCIPLRLPNRGDPAVGDWWQGGFFCPCHRSAYDYAGRVVQRPAPRNLRVPRYRFSSRSAIVIGEDPRANRT